LSDIAFVHLKTENLAGQQEWFLIQSV
jgi:hypothetical protein